MTEEDAAFVLGVVHATQEEATEGRVEFVCPFDDEDTYRQKGAYLNGRFYAVSLNESKKNET